MKYLLPLFTIVLCISCTGQNTISMDQKHQYTNELIKETSPYLLQHAHNPVHWNPWSPNVLEKATKEDKLILISIGYAACHWCHVMEHESFEDPKVAALMNANYINIKVDREERPDVDQVYMSAVQLMTGSGGWPLNVIALPDGRPVWGGTYFPKGNWIDALNQIAGLYEKQPKKLKEYADQLEKGIQSVGLIETKKEKINFSTDFIESTVKQWSTYFDHKKGGTKHVPKFMMPNNYHFLLRYAYQSQDAQLIKFVNTTLTKISYGGIFDHVGGGFARYSTDDKWLVPHFEKMLYDNAQLVSLYADAYLATKDSWYKEVVYQTLEFVERELTNPEGGFYSSLDADSNTLEGKLEEGAFYVWTKKELKEILKDDYELFSAYYNINSYGFWEKENYVLIRKDSRSDIADQFNISKATLQQKITHWKSKLLKIREKRSRPRLDDKTLTSWNALMCKGYLDAYRAFGEKKFLDAALKNAHFIKNNQLQPDNSLHHNYKKGKSTINGYLEDYATVIEAYITLYQNTFDLQWLELAEKLTTYTLEHFYDVTSGLFYFTSDLDPKLITRTIEYTDNVIPSSNSILAKSLFLLYHYKDNHQYLLKSKEMLHTVAPQIEEYGAGYSNWLDLMLNYTEEFFEIVIVGDSLNAYSRELNKYYIPNKLMAGGLKTEETPLLKNRYVENETLIYICKNNTCKLPLDTVEKAITSIKQN